MTLLAQHSLDAHMGGITSHFKRQFEIQKSKHKSLSEKFFNNLKGLLNCCCPSK